MATTLVMVDATTMARTKARDILNTAFPPRYRPPTNIPKYSRETNPRLWLEDYQLACHAGGADSDNFIIHNLPLFLANSALT